jgi:hypothetical protein|tara:strand:+ start:99 stop:764 length:666 start_codon:yes stop_codon:yes gene_type:complete
MPRNGLLGSTALTPQGDGPAATLQPSFRGDVAAPVTSEEQPNVSPDEQQQYNQLVKNAYNLLYEDMPTLLKSIAGGGDPVTGVATTAANAMSRLINSATRAGRKFPKDVILHANMEIIEDLADLAKDSNIHDFTDQEMESAAYLTVEVYRGLQQESGNIDPNEAAADLEDLQNAEANGTFEGRFPGLGAHFAGFRGQAQPTGSQSVQEGQPPNQRRAGLVR